MTKVPGDFFRSYTSELFEILDKFDPGGFDGLIEELKAANENGSHIFICGNGGSAATSAHFACDLNKGVKFNNKRFKLICLNDSLPTMLAYANDMAYSEIFVEQLKNLLNPGDLVIGLSGSGNSENVLKALKYANEHGARTFGICGFGGGRMKETARRSLVIDSRDMQKVEDAHLVIFHCAMQWFNANGKA